MSNEFRSNCIWCIHQLIALTAITAILLILTLLFDGSAFQYGILRMYHLIYILLPLVIIGILPPATCNYACMNLQFGANRRSIFYAMELANGMLLLVSILFAIGMNAFSTTIYRDETLSTNWDISILQWCYLIVLALLIWKTSQRISYQPIGNMTTGIRIKIVATTVMYVILSLAYLFCIRTGFLSILEISTPILYLISGIIFTLSGVIIVLLQRSNYRLFMKMEV